MNPKADFFFNKAGKWQKAVEQLRTIVLECGLNEEVKWGVACYTDHGNNILLIHTFKDYCAVLFFKGVLLKDSKGVLIQQTENVQAARQIRFTSVQEVVKMKSILKAYIHEAIEVERAGLKVEFKKVKEFPMADEFKSRLNKSAALKKAFYALTPGRQREYLLHFSSAKQSKTREARVEKAMKPIMSGKGLSD